MPRANGHTTTIEQHGNEILTGEHPLDRRSIQLAAIDPRPAVVQQSPGLAREYGSTHVTESGMREEPVHGRQLPQRLTAGCRRAGGLRAVGMWLRHPLF